MRKTITSAAVAVTAITALLAISVPNANAAQPAAPAKAQAVQPNATPTPFGCASGKVCFYDGRDRADLIWTESQCGFYDLRELNPPINDKISSVYNRSEANVDLYNWNPVTSGWDPVDRVFVARFTSYSDERDNTVDGVWIDC